MQKSGLTADEYGNGTDLASALQQQRVITCKDRDRLRKHPMARSRWWWGVKELVAATLSCRTNRLPHPCDQNRV